MCHALDALMALWINKGTSTGVEIDNDHTVVLTPEMMAHFLTQNDDATEDCLIGIESIFFNKIYNLPQ